MGSRKGMIFGVYLFIAIAAVAIFSIAEKIGNTAEFGQVANVDAQGK